MLFLDRIIGQVIKVGNKVKRVSVNDKVLISWIKSKSKDSKKPTYTYPDKKKKINAGNITTFSNYSIISENRLFKLKEKNYNKKMLVMGCCFPTGAGMILNQIQKKKDKRILILGLGGVGLSSLLVAKNFNFKEIYCIDINRSKINKLKNFIKDKKVIFKNMKISKKNYSHLKNKFDYVIETSGLVSNINLAITLIKNTGKVVFASHPKKGSKISIDPFELIKGKKIIGSWGGGINLDSQLNTLTQYLNKIKNFEKLFFSKIYKLKNINKAIIDFRKGKVLRPIIKMDH